MFNLLMLLMILKYFTYTKYDLKINESKRYANKTTKPECPGLRIIILIIFFFQASYKKCDTVYF